MLSLSEDAFDVIFLFESLTQVPNFLRKPFQGCVQWSTGLEHESFLVHSREESKQEYVVNVGTVAIQMARFGRVFGLDRETHSVAIYLEHTGVRGETAGKAVQ